MLGKMTSSVGFQAFSSGSTTRPLYSKMGRGFSGACTQVGRSGGGVSACTAGTASSAVASTAATERDHQRRRFVGRVSIYFTPLGKFPGKVGPGSGLGGPRPGAEGGEFGRGGFGRGGVGRGGFGRDGFGRGGFGRGGIGRARPGGAGARASRSVTTRPVGCTTF